MGDLGRWLGKELEKSRNLGLHFVNSILGCAVFSSSAISARSADPKKDVRGKRAMTACRVAGEVPQDCSRTKRTAPVADSRRVEAAAATHVRKICSRRAIHTRGQRQSKREASKPPGEARRHADDGPTHRGHQGHEARARRPPQPPAEGPAAHPRKLKKSQVRGRAVGRGRRAASSTRPTVRDIGRDEQLRMSPRVHNGVTAGLHALCEAIRGRGMCARIGPISRLLAV